MSSSKKLKSAGVSCRLGMFLKKTFAYTTVQSFKYSTWYSSAARRQLGRDYREEVRASSVSHFTSFTSTSSQGPLRNSTPQIEDQRRGTTKCW